MRCLHSPTHKLVLIFIILNISLFAQRNQYSNVLNIKTTVIKPDDVEYSCFSDLGAWHAYALPSAKEDYGSFIGPMLMDMQGEWLANSISRLHIAKNGKEVDLSKSRASLNYYPGMLQQQFETEGIKIDMKLLFISNRQSEIQTIITNTSEQKCSIELSWTGKVLSDSVRITSNATGFNAHFSKNKKAFSLSIPYIDKQGIDISGNSYRTHKKTVSLNPGKQYEEIQIHSYYPDSSEQNELKPINKFEDELLRNEKRWNKYLEDYFSLSPNLSEAEKKLAVKAIIILITNWRSKTKDLHHDGVFPSINYQGFYGVWSWDSWKQAVALSYFAPELAKENILCMFDYQNEQGMVADCIFTEKKENNWRNTKPPLSSWAVINVYKNSKDIEFIKAIYPKLLKYHTWWYANRDHDQNGLCEYGSTDGTLIAAAWESGMDNAVRFDSAVMIKNNDQAWSLNQESVDLNAYLYAEKIFLAEIATILNKPNDAAQWNKEALILKNLVNNKFFDSEKGYYYDKFFNKNELITVEGPEGWIPLWAGLAETRQAEAVKSIMEKASTFNTFVPLPTFTADHPKFNPMKGYWRGPVWLDQFYFGIEGLRRYKCTTIADEFVKKLIKNANGLFDDQPIRENYHPLTGEGLNATNFSWSASHILMLLKK